MRQSLKAAFAASLLALAVSGCASMDGMAGASGDSRTALAAAIAAPTRTPANVARDRYRNPAETLAFFGVRPTHTLVEVAPGGGWYTEILAPFVAERGRYYAVASTGGLNGVRKMMEVNPSLYGRAGLALFPAKPGEVSRVPDGSADVVLTFRNVHNWMMAKEPFADEAFRQMYAMLKPGGTLGVVEHRLPEDAPDARQLTSGYVKTSTVRRMAEAAGFRFVAASEVNANPRDTKDYADGVWTLPPTLRLKEKDREKYLAIGESDRMTLKFVKPR